MKRAPLPLPILAALAGVACLSLMDAFMKQASLAIGAFSAAWLRAVLGLALMTPIVLAAGARRPPADVLRLHLERGVISCFMALTFFYALTKLPLAEAIAISFVAPLLALYLARALLGERVTRAAIWGSLLGFAGAIVIVSHRLGRSEFDRDALLGLASILVSALLYAYNFIVIRRQSQVAGPAEIALFHSGVTALILAVGAPFLLRLPDAPVLGALATSALLTVTGAMALAWAYARAEAQVLVPMEYSGYLWAVLFGWLFFREPAEPMTVFGTVLIVIGCWIAARRQEPEQVAV